MPLTAHLVDPKTGKAINLGPAYDSQLSADVVFPANSSQFGETLVANRTPIIELNSNFSPSALRDKQTTAVDGTISQVGSEIKLSTGASANSSATLEAAEIGRYLPGYGAEIGNGTRVPLQPNNDQFYQWGGWNVDQDNGFYFEYTSEGLFVVRLRDGVLEDKIPQNLWNIDTLDGTGPSGAVVNIAEGVIFQIDYTLYNYGAVKFGIVKNVRGTQRFVPCHILSDFTETSISDPNLRIFNKVENGADGGNLDVFVGGRQYSVVGNYIPKYRFTGETRASTSVSTTRTPLVSFQTKAGFGNRSIKVSGFEVLNTGNTEASLSIVLNGTLTGDSFGTPTDYTAAETAVESDTSATAITGGEVLYAGSLVGSGQNKSPSLGGQDFDFDVPEDSTITLCATTFASTTDIISGFTLKEEW